MKRSGRQPTCIRTINVNTTTPAVERRLAAIHTRLQPLHLRVLDSISTFPLPPLCTFLMRRRFLKNQPCDATLTPGGCTLFWRETCSALNCVAKLTLGSLPIRSICHLQKKKKEKKSSGRQHFHMCTWQRAGQSSLSLFFGGESWQKLQKCEFKYKRFSLFYSCQRLIKTEL